MPSDTLPPNEFILALLIRHGQTKLNNPRAPRVRGWDNPGLSDEGKFEILLAANKTKIYRPKMVYSSDLARDSQSANLYAELMGNIPFEIDFALRTADMGTLTDMKEEDARARTLRWYQHPSEPAPGGESRLMFEKRLWEFMEPKIELARESAAFRPMAFFTHGRNIAFLDSYYRGVLAEDALMPRTGGVAVVKCDFDTGDYLKFLGETEAVQSDV